MLSRDTGHRRDYGRNPYRGYDDINQTPFLSRGGTDKRVPPMEKVVAIEIDGEFKAYPYSTFTSVNSSSVVINGVPIEIGLARFTRTTPTDGNNFLIRFDHRVGDNDNITFRYSRDSASSPNLISNTQFGSLFAGDQVIVDQNILLAILTFSARVSSTRHGRRYAG